MKYLNFVVFVIFVGVVFICFPARSEFVAAKNSLDQIILNIDEKQFVIDDKSDDRYMKLTELQKKNLSLDYHEKIKIAKKLLSMGFSSGEVLNYTFPFLFTRICEVIKNETIPAKNAFIDTITGTGNIKLNKSKTGFKMDKNQILNNILYKIINFDNKIKITKTIDFPQLKVDDLKEYSFLKSEFKTGFASSNSERKSNINLALLALDGVVVDPREVLSFNEIVGERSEENGYKIAKVISKGKYIEAVGGGVCQVSTTLYNACLLAGLEILESHPHSLMVGYVEPGFDSMVNSGSSDLKIRNNTEKPVIIATSSRDDICLIRIYGIQNKYKVLRKYEHEKESVNTSDSNIIIPGSFAKTYIQIYDNDNLVEEKLVRMSKYKPLIKE